MEFGVLNFLITVKTSLVEGLSSTNYGCRFWLDDDCGLKLSNNHSCLFRQHWVRAEELMIHALLDSNFGTSKILEPSDREWKGSVVFHDLGEESSGTLTLEVILLVQLSAVDGGSSLCLSAHAISGRGINIKMDDISRGEFPVVHSLLWSLLVDDAFVSIDQVLLGLVRENTLHWLNLIFGHHCGDLGSHILVKGSDLDRSSGSHEGIVGSEDNICLLAVGLTSNNDGVGTVGCESIDVGSELNLDNILSLKLLGIVSAWGVVTADLID